MAKTNFITFLYYHCDKCRETIGVIGEYVPRCRHGDMVFLRKKKQSIKEPKKVNIRKMPKKYKPKYDHGFGGGKCDSKK